MATEAVSLSSSATAFSLVGCCSLVVWGEWKVNLRVVLRGLRPLKLSLEKWVLMSFEEGIWRRFGAGENTQVDDIVFIMLFWAGFNSEEMKLGKMGSAKRWNGGQGFIALSR